MEHETLPYHLLLVDDDEKNLSSLKRVFAVAGNTYSCQTAASAEEAYQIASREKIDLLLTDYSMPGQTGADLAQKVSFLYPEAVCIILSGRDDFKMAVDIINKAVVYKFISKPWNDAELLQTVSGALRERDLARENRNLQVQMKKMMRVIDDLERENPGITELRRDTDGSIIID